jgi:hypothetical protein
MVYVDSSDKHYVSPFPNLHSLSVSGAIEAQNLAAKLIRWQRDADKEDKHR